MAKLEELNGEMQTALAVFGPRSDALKALGELAINRAN
jgi:hypothetical protein